MTDRLGPGEALLVNQSLSSANGQYSLVLQDDGNLVLYDAAGAPIWATGTDGATVDNATMQADGNLVIYSPDGVAVWASDTFGQEGTYLAVQDDGNVVIYGGDGNPLWATDTARQLGAASRRSSA